MFLDVYYIDLLQNAPKTLVFAAKPTDLFQSAASISLTPEQWPCAMFTG